MTEKERISREISREKSRLEGLYADIESTKARISELQTRLNENLSTQPNTERDSNSGRSVHQSNKAKIAIFRSLFRGREDVFARFWENRRTGRSGYSPACRNEWDRTLCAKSNRSSSGRRKTCATCQNQRFIAVSDRDPGTEPTSGFSLRPRSLRKPPGSSGPRS